MVPPVVEVLKVTRLLLCVNVAKALVVQLRPTEISALMASVELKPLAPLMLISRVTVSALAVPLVIVKAEVEACAPEPIFKSRPIVRAAEPVRPPVFIVISFATPTAVPPRDTKVLFWIMTLPG